ncbi:ribosomal rna small subunit methyltransferase nep1 [Quercus suber]|uniref:Ribosomal rna small subunit methyltransferase nep1 n=1 Tax=Quercus suber TaxID=58331 RepID=A0AAW0IRK5_QUESU
MVRVFAMKGEKRKNREERHDIEQDAKRAITENTSDGEEEGKRWRMDLRVFQLSQVTRIILTKPGSSSFLKRYLWKSQKLESYQLLNSDDHAYFLKKNNKNPADYRPDIVHQALLCSGSPNSQLNKSGMVQAVYVKTEKGILFEVKPYTCPPRTFKHFCGLMCKFNMQLLQKLSITAVGKREKLLRAIKNPVSRYLPVNSHKIGEFRKIGYNYVDSADSDVELVFVVGAMAHGKIDRQDTDDLISSMFFFSTLFAYTIPNSHILFVCMSVCFLHVGVYFFFQQI